MTKKWYLEEGVSIQFLIIVHEPLEDDLMRAVGKFLLKAGDLGTSFGETVEFVESVQRTQQIEIVNRLHTVHVSINPVEQTFLDLINYL